MIAIPILGQFPLNGILTLEFCFAREKLTMNGLHQKGKLIANADKIEKLFLVQSTKQNETWNMNKL